jgi:hypothetical protein
VLKTEKLFVIEELSQQKIHLQAILKDFVKIIYRFQDKEQNSRKLHFLSLIRLAIFPLFPTDFKSNKSKTR